MSGIHGDVPMGAPDVVAGTDAALGANAGAAAVVLGTLPSKTNVDIPQWAVDYSSGAIAGMACVAVGRWGHPKGAKSPR